MVLILVHCVLSSALMHKKDPLNYRNFDLTRWFILYDPLLYCATHNYKGAMGAMRAS